VTPEINDFLKKITTAKGVVVLLVAIGIAIFVWHNFNFLTEVTFTIKNHDSNATSAIPKKDSEKTTGYVHIELEKAFVPPATKNIPSVMFFKIVNNGNKDASSLRVFVDIGAAKIYRYETIGASKITSDFDQNASVIGLNIDTLRANENIYICLETSSPEFSKLVVSSPDMPTPLNIDKIASLSSNTDNTGITFIGALKFLLFMLLLIFSFYLLFVLIRKLNGLFKLQW